jgi:ABC-type transport system involved in Fe-S cluster assembly fused permease/ATPase subunit
MISDLVIMKTIVQSDQIFVLNAGRIVESGTHDALLAEKGEYSSLWQKQVNSSSGVPEEEQ